MAVANGRALVTGGSRGIGRAIAEALARDGHDVIAVARTREALEVVGRTAGIEPVPADVADPGAVDELAARAGEIEIVVHAAGVLRDACPFQEIDPDAIEQMVRVNLVAPMRLTRMLLPGMIARRRGHLFFLGSSGGRLPGPDAAAYGASKAGLGLFCDALRADLLGTGLRVTEIVPGRVETTLYHHVLGEETARQRLYDGFRPIPSDAIAELVLAALRMPASVDVSRFEVFPTDQAPAGFRMVSPSREHE